MKLTKIALAFLFLTIIGCKEKNKFEETFDKPIWFKSIEAPEVKNSDEVSALWQSQKRCCEDAVKVLNNNRIFYKSCYNAISRYYKDEELVVLCLWLMDSGANQHFIKNEENLENAVDISDINLTVEHPNTTTAKITKVGNYRLNKNVVLFDVLLVP